MRFVGNILLSTKYEFYFDDVTVTSFIDIKCRNLDTKRGTEEEVTSPRDVSTEEDLWNNKKRP